MIPRQLTDIKKDVKEDKLPIKPMVPRAADIQTDYKLISKGKLNFGCMPCIFKRTLLGKGATGSVYQAKYQNYPVAVKEFQGESNEVVIHSKLNSPYIVKFIGDGKKKDKNPNFMVTELMQKGSLWDHLFLTMIARENRFDWYILTKIFFDVASSMSYLHHKGLVHGDIRSPNILIDDNNQAKLSDFEYTAKEGMVRRGYDFWAAPELADPNIKHTKKTDIYSFGMLLLEVVSELDCSKGDLGILEIYKRHTPAIIINLIKDCTQTKPEDRPSTDAILLRLVNLLNQINPNNIQFDLKEDPTAQSVLPPLTPKKNNRKLGIFKKDSVMPAKASIQPTLNLVP